MAHPPPPPPPMGASNLALLLGPPAKMPAGRDALLGDIHKGMKLKKTVTVDKSKPLLDAKPSPIGAGGPSIPSGRSPSSNSPAASMPVGPLLGDIFAGGMPKLKSVKDNRSGTVPPSTPKIPVSGALAQISTTAPSAPRTRPAAKKSAPSVAPGNPPPPVVPNSAPPPLPGAGPPPLPPSSPPSSSSASSSLKVPNPPPNRPKKLTHLRSSSYSSVNSAESVASSSRGTSPAPPAPPPPLVPPPVPVFLEDMGGSELTPVPPPSVPPFAPALPGVLPFLAEINSRRTGGHNDASLTKAAPKAPGSGPPPPPALSVPLVPPPPANLALPRGSETLPKPIPGGSGGLPFLAEINAKRSDAFVVNESSNFTTRQAPGLCEKTEPPVPTPKKAVHDPPRVPSPPPAPKAPRIPKDTQVPKALQAPPAPPAPPTSFSPPVPPVPPVPPITHQISKQFSGLNSDDRNYNDESQVSGQGEASKAMPPPTHSVPRLSPSAPPSLPPSMLPSIPPSSTQQSSQSLSRLFSKKKAAPPPPPASSALDRQQSAGLNLRKISALAYTINTLQRKNTSESAKVVIEDKRFKFINGNALPNPRRFEGKEKLYPSGRGSSVPLDLASF